METKQEFIDGLRRALTGRINQQEVEEHIRYYDEYITAEMRMGRAEADVLKELGEPRLIAMSICAAGEAAGGNTKENATNRYQRGYDGYEEYEDYQGQRGDTGRDENSGIDSRPFIFRHPKLTIALVIVAILIVIVLVIALAFSLLQILWPVILIVVIIGLVMRLMAYLRDR